MGVIQNWIAKYKETQKNQEFQKVFNERKAMMQQEIINDTKALINESQKVKLLQDLYDIKDVNNRWQFINQTSYFDSWKSTQFQRDFLKSIVEDDTKLKSYLISAHDDYLKRKYRLELKTAKSDFMRPNTTQDIQERKNALENVTKSIQRLDKNNQLNLRFHSTNITATQSIIKSGGIIASVDRLNGYQFDTGNNSNEIAVTDISSMQHSVESWTDLQSYNENMPAGCMFVLKPSSQAEIDMINHRCMNNVYFGDGSDRLVAIVTTSENLPMVQKWMEQQGYDKNVVTTFDNIGDYIKEKFNIKEKETIQIDDDFDR